MNKMYFIAFITHNVQSGRQLKVRTRAFSLSLSVSLSLSHTYDQHTIDITMRLLVLMSYVDDNMSLSVNCIYMAHKSLC